MNRRTKKDGWSMTAADIFRAARYRDHPIRNEELEGPIDPAHYKLMKTYIKRQWKNIFGKSKPVFPLFIEECYVVKIDGKKREFVVRIEPR